MIDPAKVALFVPDGLKKFKLALFERIGRKIEAAGGRLIRGEHAAVERLPDDIIPIIGCTPQFRNSVARWKETGREFITWDRGYLRRVFATWLPRGSDGGYYRWTRNAFQMRAIRDVPDDRWRALKIENEVKPWRKGGRHIVIADTGFDYWDLHADRKWSKRIAAELKQYTDREIIVREKEDHINVSRGRPASLAEELQDAHALVTHGSIAAVESVVMGCPVFVHADSAASLVGMTDFTRIETPVYPERQQWLNALAYGQFNEAELVDGTLWRLIE